MIKIQHSQLSMQKGWIAKLNSHVKMESTATQVLKVYNAWFTVDDI